jgi:hypothetical protein
MSAPKSESMELQLYRETPERCRFNRQFNQGGYPLVATR